MSKWTLGTWILWLFAMLSFFCLCYLSSYLLLVAMKGRTDIGVVASLAFMMIGLAVASMFGIRRGIFARWYHGYVEMFRDAVRTWRLW